jgi:hypothetical protein
MTSNMHVKLWDNSLAGSQVIIVILTTSLSSRFLIYVSSAFLIYRLSQDRGYHGRVCREPDLVAGRGGGDRGRVGRRGIGGLQLHRQQVVPLILHTSFYARF